MNLRFKRLTRLALVALLTLALLATAGVASAAPKEGRGSEDEHGKEGFSDSEDAPWAALFMEKMNLEGVVLGMPDGTFKPNAPVTHEQAVTMVIRVMGLEAEAKTKTGAGLTFKDSDKISSWALGYVEEAVEKNILSWGQDGLFKPNEPATRLEITVMMVKALGKTAEAAAQTGTPDFKDSSTIPSELVGFILFAADQGLVTGAPSPNGKGYVFQGNKPVTRAEMTAFMDREDGALGEEDEHEVRGTVASVATTGDPSITLTKKDGSEDTYKVAADARIYVEKKPGQLADIKAGDQANLHLDANGVATFIDIRYIDHVSGYVKAISATSLTIVAKSGEELTYNIDPNCKVVIESEDEGDTTGTTPTTPTVPTVADIQVGDRVSLELSRETVTKIEVKELNEVSGTVTGTTPASITVQTKEGATLTYNLAAEVQVRFEEQEQAANLTDILVGDKVELKFQNRLVAEIKVEHHEGAQTPSTQTLGGAVKSVDATGGTFVLTVQPATAGGAAVDYTVTTTATTNYLKAGQAASFTDLAVGQSVEVTGQAGTGAAFAAEKVEIK
ncbi:MAG: S-layer homology domain-containing protein [Bacillota bacterium]